MADVHSSEQRSRNMAAIRGKDTKPEVWLRKRLFARGFRYRLHDRKLPGRPDLVFPKHRAVIFVHGCFWHWHGCRLSKLPATRAEWWKAKLFRNREKDRESLAALHEQGWRVLTVWECGFRGTGRPTEAALDEVAEQAAAWLCSDTIEGTLPAGSGEAPWTADT